MKRHDYHCLLNESWLAKKSFPSVQRKIASKKAVPKNSTTAVNLAFRVFLNWVHHSKEVEGRINTAQDLWILVRILVVSNAFSVLKWDSTKSQIFLFLNTTTPYWGIHFFTTNLIQFTLNLWKMRTVWGTSTRQFRSWQCPSHILGF